MDEQDIRQMAAAFGQYCANEGDAVELARLVYAEINRQTEDLQRRLATIETKLLLRRVGVK